MAHHTLILLILGFSLAAPGWEDHFRVTASALNSLGLKHQTVAYVPLEQALKSTKLQFIEKHFLNKNYKFENKLKEKPGQPVSAREILSTYSDEPDWGADQNLFESDQYPELWKDELKYVSMKTGEGSQGFRHMYFVGKWLLPEPIDSIQIPQRAIGEAPDRAQLFYDISKKLYGEGQFYWAYRFRAWTLHFVEDLFQPFHVRQTPSKKFLRFKWAWGFLLLLDIPASADQISYYHSSVERWIAKEAERPESVLHVALQGEGKLHFKHESSLKEFILNDLVPLSSSFASRIGVASVRFFPLYTSDLGMKPEAYIGTPDWWRLQNKGKEIEKDLTGIAKALYSHMGDVVRQVVASLDL